MIVTEAQAAIVGQVLEERARQIEKWGTQLQNTPCQWATILAEEVGEVSRHAIELEHDAYPKNDATIDALRGMLADELVQVCAVSMAWLEALKR